ncbi:cysteine--1-D-myo-inosityl 2-amino-2-deoxy-alpha-D-glucopyranoside ligase [Phycicoccus endophyticus]|uniref:L-cysteine:1D-myo-inositol 2-amino-2-deoxy-alpha-D-glucopyranoside ligase n=1 Tax=Phycicoccus endophyticus TaxID=1690220 RepID=A0A7G9R4I1_9MICO|nr:cysteine--1-D-myo-inosityl 2-amino-2-deoxy-alpha-D-glucopyranoside ligase [Phycicoccus endophyticus]NHI18392.1 cysteine--1-D-myo-inosityl 2-amino-2-deoxy-alpha-D-glucopyranoside ligase [Phycicoccus endophyticus]QNN50506.1 cysteine--1-D-myo-inosityl 2-amino-2-deoxy-alpha-D-glucopyranoside ligase [Phycicoccus endophyticus]
MKSWPAPAVPAIPGAGVHLRLYDTSRREVGPIEGGQGTRMYVCGVTPYDATHLGHAATYVTFDVVMRAMLDCGHDVEYVQNVTDVDDPLLERAARDGRDWRELALSEIDLFREDMTALGVIPPTEFRGVVESMDEIAAAVRRLLESGSAYRLPVPADEGDGEDVYLDLSRSRTFGEVSHWTREQMLAVFPERGGDPERPGKRDPLDPLLWRGARTGEPAWADEVLGAGRPGWHIECTAISLAHLGIPFDIKGGGSDLVFPHHEMSAAQATALTGGAVFARHYVHQAMVGYDGGKMSKSRGNLVLVSRLRAAGVDPMALRLLLLDQHYRTEWEFTDALLTAAQRRLERWREAFSVPAGVEAEPTLQAVRESVADDLATPRALAAVDDWCTRTLAGEGGDPAAPGVLARTVDALLGVRL